MNKEALLAELHWLLDLGEPLLDVFPKEHPHDWLLQLPDNISDDMDWYANNVSWRAYGRDGYQDLWQHTSVVFVTRLVKECEAGLLGWRAVGALR